MSAPAAGGSGSRGTRARAARLGGSAGAAATAKATASDSAESVESVESTDRSAPTARSSPGKSGSGKPLSSRSASGKSASEKSGSGRSTVAKGHRGQPLDPERVVALTEERDFLLGSLRDLEAEHAAGDVDDRDYDSLRDDYTARAAATIRALESDQVARSRSGPARSNGRRILVAALVVVFSVGAGVLVAQWSGSRGTGDSITGGIRGDTRDELLAARQDGADGQYLEAVKEYNQVLQLDPANTEALAYKGWMLRIVSTSASGSQRSQLQAEALASLQQALRTSPTDGTSLVFMAVLLGDLGRPQDALNELAKVPAGQMPTFMSSTIDQFKAQMQAQLASGSTTTTG